jgi:hypothetical protein
VRGAAFAGRPFNFKGNVAGKLGAAVGPFSLRVRLTTAYTHATLGEKVMSLVTKLEFCRVVFTRLDKSLGNKVIQNSPFVRLQISAGSLK